MNPEPTDQLNILVIDDDEDIRALMIKILLPHEHQVFAVGSAEEGLNLLPYNTFHVAFLDQNLPGMEGLVLGEYLRKNNPSMKVALVTGEDDPKLSRLGGAFDITVIAKPFEVRQILDVVSAYQSEQAKRVSLEPPPRGAKEVPWVAHWSAIAEAFGSVNVPERVEERLTKTVRAALSELRSESRYSDQTRVVATAGIVALEVLGLRPEKLAKELDDILAGYGLPRTFTVSTDSE
ncbi:MAG: response regulator [Myxococcota bacterium]